MRKRKLQTVPKTTSGRVFSSNHTTPWLSAAGLCSNTQQQQQTHLPPSCIGPTHHSGRNECNPPLRHNQQEVPSQSIQTRNVNNLSLNYMFNVAMVFLQIMTELKGAKSEEDRTVGITNILLKLMKQNWPWQVIDLSFYQNRHSTSTKPQLSDSNKWW
jgi:hypothetical protein